MGSSIQLECGDPEGNDGDPCVTGGGETRTANWAQIVMPASRQ